MSGDILQRRAAVEKRIARASNAVRDVEQACGELRFGEHTLAELDDDQVVALTLRTVVPLAINTPGFDLTLVVDPAGEWGVRLHNLGEEIQVTARRLGAPVQDAPEPVDEGDSAQPETPTVRGTGFVVTELADLLRQ